MSEPEPKSDTGWLLLPSTQPCRPAVSITAFAAFAVVVVPRATSPGRTSILTWRYRRSLSGTVFPLRDIDQSPNSNLFPRSHNRFPLGATSIPDNDNRIPHNDNRFPLNDNAFPDNDNGRRAEFPVSGPLAPANGEKFANQMGRKFFSKRLFLQGNRGREVKGLGRKRPNSL